MSNVKVLFVGALLLAFGAQAVAIQERNIVGGVVVPFIEGLDSTLQLGITTEELLATEAELVVTQTELALTQAELIFTQTELAITQTQLAVANAQIDEASLLLSGTAIPDAAEIDSLISQLFHDTSFPGSNPPPPLANQINNGLLPYLQAAIDKLSNVGHIKQIALGTGFSFILLDNGKIYGLGRNDGGELGVGSLDSPLLSLTLMDLSPLGSAIPVALSAGAFTSYVLSNDGKVFAVGQNTNGELGIGTSGDFRSTLTAMDLGPLGGAHATAIVGGVNNFLLLASDNTLYGTGMNSSGELGTGDLTSPILTLTKMNLAPLGVGVTPVAVTAGQGFTVVLASDGKIYGVGSNSSGQLGLGNQVSPQLTLTQMALSPLAGATPTAVEATKQVFTIVLANNGKIYGTGINTNGELGLGVTGNKSTLTQMIMSPLGSALPEAIAVGSNVTLVLTNDCKIFGTGRNSQGQLGVGDATRRLTLTAMNLAPLGTALPTAITVSGVSSLVLADNGLVYGAGFNSNGELDTGNTTRVLTLTAMRELVPVPVLTKFPIG